MRDHGFLFQDHFRPHRASATQIVVARRGAAHGPMIASSVGLTVAPAARADRSVFVTELIVSPCRSGRRLKAMTAIPTAAPARAITGGGGSLASLFIPTYVIASARKDKGVRY